MRGVTQDERKTYEFLIGRRKTTVGDVKRGKIFFGGENMNIPILSDRFLEQACIFKNMCWRDLLVIRKKFFDELINCVTWPISFAITFGYVLPSIGQDSKYGSFLMIGVVASTFFYLSMTLGNTLVDDFCSLRFFEHQLLVPVASYKMILWQRVFMFTIHGTLLSLPVIPIGKAVLLDKLDLSHICIGKLLLIAPLTGVLFGFFALWLASWVTSGAAFSSMWRRVYTPLQLFGCYWFSFAMFTKAFPVLGYASLLVPLTYATEGVRSSVLGPDGFINFWISLSALTVYTIVFGWYAMQMLKRRLDMI